MSMAKDSDAQWDICPSPNQICLHFFYYLLLVVDRMFLLIENRCLYVV